MAYSNGFDVNQQKRIAFLSLHGHFMSAVKQEREIDGKKHVEMCNYIFAVVDNLFEKFPMEKEEKLPSIKRVDITPF